MAICCAGKKQKVSHPVTSSLNHRSTSEKHNGLVDHSRLKSNSSTPIRHRSQSHFNHSSMPHDLSRTSANSASSSALTYAYGTPQATTSNATNNHRRHQQQQPKNLQTFEKMDISDDDDDDGSETDNNNKQKSKHKAQQVTNRAAKASVIHADMIFYCFEILGSYLFNGKHQLGKYYSLTNGQTNPSPLLPPALPTDPYPLFVTWLIGSERKLRGCIGTFTPMNLAHGLREYALTSATNDSRFSPISRDEYPLLSCAVSILTNFEPCSSFTDWDIGLHGIRIEFLNERGSKRSATYLPEVAHEQGWNHVQTLDSLLRKGGYKASITSDLRKSVQVTRYRSEKLTLHYNDYIQAKSPSSFPTIIRQQF